MKSLYLLILLTGCVPVVLPESARYYLIQQKKKWSDAQAYCQGTYTDLAIIENNDQMVRFQQESQYKQFSSSAWIGLYNDINSWRWSFRNEPLGSMRKWMNGEPNNSGGRQACVALTPWGWTDKDCTSKYAFVCIDEGESGVESYINISNKVAWLDAQSYCRQYHTDLASTANENEFSAVKAFFPFETWIGLFRDSWKWIDKSKFSTISWMSTKPDNKLANENCGYINNSQAGDALCSDEMPFYCYAPITGKKQVVRMKIQSTQDMSDRAVKAAILAQIKQKLKNHGMAENNTVIWREQHNGR